MTKIDALEWAKNGGWLPIELAPVSPYSEGSSECFWGKDANGALHLCYRWQSKYADLCGIYLVGEYGQNYKPLTPITHFRPRDDSELLKALVEEIEALRERFRPMLSVSGEVNLNDTIAEMEKLGAERLPGNWYVWDGDDTMMQVTRRQRGILATALDALLAADAAWEYTDTVTNNMAKQKIEEAIKELVECSEGKE